MWSWGDGDYGKLGRGGSDSSKVPKLVTNWGGPSVEVTKIACGSQFSVAMSRDGRVFSWLVAC